MCLISRFVEDVNTGQPFFFFSRTLIRPFRIQLQKNLPKFVEFKRDGINAIKFEAARIHFFSDVFVAVAFIVAKVPDSRSFAAKCEH